MHPPTDNPAIPRPRPDHSVCSILLMVVLAAGVLAGMQALYARDFTVVQQWSFNTMDPQDGPWSFPDAERARTPRGIAFVAQDSGPGPVLAQEFDAGNVGRIRIWVEVTRVADGTPIPYVAQWYWASPDDVAAAAGSWPFAEERSATFREPDRHQPELRELDLRNAPRWRGRIASLHIAFKLPGSEAGPYRIETRAIEFLE